MSDAMIYTEEDIEEIAYGIDEIRRLFQAWAAIGEGIESIRAGEFCQEHATMFSIAFDVAKKLDTELSKLDRLADERRAEMARHQDGSVAALRVIVGGTQH